jgi:hypothetical protein
MDRLMLRQETYFHDKAQANIARAGHRDLEPAFLTLAEIVKPFTMTSIERMYALWTALRHVADARIAGDIVECGVWKGGSMMLAALTLLRARDAGRDLVLYDTFAGQPPPGPEDSDIWGQDQRESWAAHVSDGEYVGSQAGIMEVSTNMARTGYPSDRIKMIGGKIEETAPHDPAARIAVLRLDTDWYASTRHALERLYPLLSPGGVLILDDYGHLAGARKAADEYFAWAGNAPLLHRVDYSGRVGVKP